MSTVVKDVMTTEVIWVEEDAPFAVMAAALRQYRVSAFPVLNVNGQVSGVVSEADMLAKEALADGDAGMPGMIAGILRHRELAKARGVTARDLMTTPAVTVPPAATVEHAARLLYLHRVKRLPVTDADCHLVGIVSRADVLSVFGRPDEAIRADVLADVAAHAALVHPDTVAVAVRNGIVTLTGVPEPPATGHDIVWRARHVEGVAAVRDRFTYPPAGPDRFDVLANSPAD